MLPRLPPGATLLVDRHYNSLKPYRKGELNLYAVLKNDNCVVRYVELAGNNVILRPQSQSSPADFLQIPDSKSPSDYLVGRIAQVSTQA